MSLYPWVIESQWASDPNKCLLEVPSMMGMSTLTLLFACFCFSCFFYHFVLHVCCSAWAPLDCILPPSGTQNVWFYLSKTHVFEKSHFSKILPTCRLPALFSTPGTSFLITFSPLNIWHRTAFAIVFLLSVFLSVLLEQGFGSILVASRATVAPPGTQKACFY